MRVNRISCISLIPAIMLLGGCAAEAGPTPSPAVSESEDSVDISALLGDAQVLVDWEGRSQTSLASLWALTPIVGDGIPDGDQLHAEWSPDGTTIVFALDPGDGTRDIWTADAATGDAQVLVDCENPCVWTDEPSFAPDGVTDGYIQGDAATNGDGIGTLRTIPLTGGDPTVVFTSEPTVYPFSVAWSPDGSSWAVELLRFATTDVSDEQVTGSAVGIVGSTGQVSLLTDYDDMFGYPDWSPDGSVILLSSDELWTVPATGGDPAPLTTLGDEGGRAVLGTYSPDGTAIVFNVEQPAGSSPSVVVMAASGGAVIALGKGTHPQVQPR